MIRLAVSVEGATEREFVKTVLVEHFRPMGVELQPFVLGRARARGAGGNVTVSRLTSEMARLYYSFDAVTSLVDFYGFRDKGDRAVGDLERDLLDEVAARVGQGWDARRVVPYVQRHEFEGLLFSKVEVFGNQIDFPRGCVGALRAVRAQFESPEDINDSSETAPSKRIKRAIPVYRKPVHGPMLAREIGIDTICNECSRFNAWLARLESLGPSRRSVRRSDV